MKFSSLLSGALIALSACSPKESKQEEAVKEINLSGQWYIENIVFNDSTYVRPAEEVPGSRQYITFDSESYFIQTNCNTMAGSYEINGDSLSLGDGAITEMACDNMATEDALRHFIMQTAVIDIENDSITRLNFIDSGAYIILRKATEKK